MLDLTGPFGGIIKVILIAGFLLLYVGPKLGLQLPAWVGPTTKVFAVLVSAVWIAVAVAAVYGAWLYFSGRH